MEGNKKIFVERETFESKGKTYFGYYIKGTVRGRDVKVGIAPPDKDTDKGGYAVLDIVFGNADKAELVLVPYEIRDERRRRLSRAIPTSSVLSMRTARSTNVR